MRTVASSTLHACVQTVFQRESTLALQESFFNRVAPQRIASNIAFVWGSLPRPWSLPCWNSWRTFALLLSCTLLLASSNTALAQVESDSQKANRLIGELSNVLTTGRFTEQEREAISTNATLKDLGTKLDKLVKERGPRIHILKATYGDHRTGRVCDASAYFLGQCEGKASCPTYGTGSTDVINGALLCGYEPAPLAKEGSNAAKVTYGCVSYSLRNMDEVTCTGDCVKSVTLGGKGQIVCDAP